MSKQNKLRNLENKKKELIRNIQSCIEYQERIIKFSNELKKQYDNEIISHKKYIEILHKTLQGKTPKEWNNYYNDYIKYYKHNLISCEKEIGKLERNQFAPIMAVLSIFILLGAVLYFLGPAITGLVVGEEILIIETEPIIEEELPLEEILQ